MAGFDGPSLELLILTYAAAQNRSLFHVLTEELAADAWNCFRCAVAFISDRGNFPDLLRAVLAFAHRGAIVEMTFGADS